jgi:hypothetical protein
VRLNCFNRVTLGVLLLSVLMLYSCADLARAGPLSTLADNREDGRG